MLKDTKEKQTMCLIHFQKNAKKKNVPIGPRSGS